MHEEGLSSEYRRSREASFCLGDYITATKKEKADGLVKVEAPSEEVGFVLPTIHIFMYICISRQMLNIKLKDMMSYCSLRSNISGALLNCRKS